MNDKLSAPPNIYYILLLRKIFLKLCIIFGSTLWKKVPLTKVGQIGLDGNAIKETRQNKTTLPQKIETIFVGIIFTGDF